jgi:glycosyltransferase involved in cell wall biosynthesis
MKISIIVPAYNEERRIKKTILAYNDFFRIKQQETGLVYEFIIVLNGCIDKTKDIVEQLQTTIGDNIIIVVTTDKAGKGLAIKLGFENALTRDNHYIGFVDADMATSPDAYYDLLYQCNGYDGIIASRYIAGAHIIPTRPLYKRWGSRLIYEPFVYCLFGLSYYDLQCGAKLFKKEVIAQVVPYLTVQQWAFDVEILYLCKKFGFTIKEIATVWHDQADSKLTLRGGLRMFGALFTVWRLHRKL